MDESDHRPIVDTTLTSETGVGIVRSTVSRSTEHDGLGWVIRELPTADVGIDAILEVVTSEAGAARASGRILGAQIKSGSSYFSNDDGPSWSVYIPKSKVRYWQAFSVPVLIFLVDTETESVFWERVDVSDHEATRKNFRIRVPKSNRLGASSRATLMRIAENTTKEGRKLARLRADRSLIDLLLAGEELAVDIAHWINKSSSRGDITVGVVSEDPYSGDPPGLKAIESFTVFGASGTRQFVETFFPWAEVTVDEDFVYSLEDELYGDYLAATGTYDSEDGRYLDIRGTFSMEPFLNPDSPAPYAEHAGEIESYRFRIKLAELGRAFAVVDEYLRA